MLSDGTWSYTWEHGRELASMSNGTTTWSFVYDANGMRTQKTNGTTTYKYVYNDSSLSQMTVGNDKLYFAYDAGGTPMSVTYNGTTYYYVTNIQGDIIEILNSFCYPVVTYRYDAWGNLLSTTGSMASTLGTLNPLRYRGYVYDQETALYYLQSRYYNPEMGRFINPDNVVSGVGGDVRGYNIFAYCMNNPVNMSDSTGDWPSWNQIKSGFENAINKIGDILSTLAKPFEAQIGVGLGIGGDLSDTVTAEFSRDSYIGIDDGKIVTGNVIVSEISLLDSNLRIGNTYNHRVEEDGQRISNSGKLSDGPFDMMDYPDVTHGNEFALVPIAINSEGDLLISFSASIHLVFGGHVSIAYNISELSSGLIELF